jgi:bacterioferritin-associated ferredoxin
MPQLNPWVRCSCGKVHVLTHTGWGTECPECGANLRELWRAKWEAMAGK